MGWCNHQPDLKPISFGLKVSYPSKILLVAAHLLRKIFVAFFFATRPPPRNLCGDCKAYPAQRNARNIQVFRNFAPTFPGNSAQKYGFWWFRNPARKTSWEVVVHPTRCCIDVPGGLPKFWTINSMSKWAIPKRGGPGCLGFFLGGGMKNYPVMWWL